MTGPEGGLNGTLSPAVEIFVPTASNNFAMEPRLLATPRISGVQFSFAATQEFGLAWVPVSEGFSMIIAIFSFNGAPFLVQFYCRLMNWVETQGDDDRSLEST